MPGRQNAKDWLTLKIVECTAVPMDDRMAECLAVYNSAYNALCQWGEDSPQQEDSQETQGFTLPMAKAWTEKMENEDGTRGPHWSIEQAKQFTQATQVTSLTITKLDGTAKGGVVIGISDQFRIPVRYIGIGEGIDQLKMFDRKEFVNALFGSEAK